MTETTRPADGTNLAGLEPAREPLPSGLDRIAAAFATARAEGRAALMPYYTVGFPDLATSEAVIQAIAGAGADLIELGIPFSDPIADGPTIQYSTNAALQAGASVARCFETAAHLRANGLMQPFLAMGYYNPILAYGPERFAADAAKAGIDGFIVPDLPLEESEQLAAAARLQQQALAFLLAPTSPPERVAAVASHSTGFVYLVSVTGVTGARRSLPTDLAEFVGRVRAVTDTPIAVGFGISTPGQAERAAKLADGVIVGSALINAVRAGSNAPDAAAAFVRSLGERLSSTGEVSPESAG